MPTFIRKKATKGRRSPSSASPRTGGHRQPQQARSKNNIAAPVKGLFASVAVPDANAAVTEALQQLDVFAEIPAVPGSGKTTALVGRINWLVGAGVPVSKILVLSFAKKSVEHVNARLGPLADRVTVSTGHAFGLKVVKANKELLGLSKVPKVETGRKATARLAKVVQKVAEDVAARAEKKSARRAAAALFDTLKGRVLGRLQTLLEIREASQRKLSDLVTEPPFAEWAPHLVHVKSIRRAFARSKASAGVIHFSDMAGLATRAIRESGSFGGYTHILADEYQDCSPQQVAMLAALAPRVKSLVVVGDPLQSIYGWAGSSYTEFRPEGKEVQRLSMAFSHRLTGANAAFGCALMGKAADAIRTKRRGTIPVLYEGTNHLEQARQVVEQINSLVAGGTSPDKIAVLARQKKLLRAVHAGLLATVPCRLTHLTGVLEDQARNAPLDVLWLVRQIAKAKDNDVKLTADKLRAKLAGQAEAGADWKQAAAALRAIRNPSLAGRFAQAGLVYLKLCGGQRDNKHLRDRLNLWTGAARGMASMARLNRVLETQAVPFDTPAVTLASIHAAKGGQWDHVFVLGVTDGLMPDYRSLQGRQLEEERRLLYVAVTRARRTLQLYHAPHRLTSGEEANRRSRFLKKAIKAGLLRVVGEDTT